jgi:hypothetical protein
LLVGLEVPESGDDSMGLVDGVAAAAALTQNLPVFESGDHVLDAGCDPAVLPAMVVGHGASGLVASRCGDGWDAEVAAVPEDPSATVEQVRDWDSPETVEASAIRSSDVRETEEVRPGVP